MKSLITCLFLALLFTVWQGDEIGGGIGVGPILSSRDFTVLLDE